MKPNNLSLLRAKEIAAIVAWVAWGVLFFLVRGADAYPFFLAGWLCTVLWVALDEQWRRGRTSFWTVLTFFTGPLGCVLYYNFRSPVQPVCSQCGSTMPSQWRPCPACGHMILLGRMGCAIADIYSRLTDSLVRGPADKAKETAKHLAIALAAASIVSAVMSGSLPLLSLITVLSAAAYWVMTAWWVYLDSAWRKMDGVPWAVLTLLTNVVGLVTYLVIRYPDPRTCGYCGATVATGLKYCPFCGSEVEPMCPHCGALVKSDWQFCPTCSAKLTQSKAPEFREDSSGVTISGSVIDTGSGDPVEGATVRIDSSETNVSAVTDSTGRFTLTGLDRRSYVLTASAEGYDLQAKVYSADSDSGKRFCFALKRLTGW